MKFAKVLRIIGLTLILSLLLAAFPVLPVQAANDFSISPTSGKIGDTIEVTGYEFTTYASEGDLEYYAAIFFAKDNQPVGSSSIIGDPENDDVDTYDMTTGLYDIQIDEDGDFEGSFTVPDRLSEGSDDEDVTTGTYYVYVTITRFNNASGIETVYHSIRGKDTFTVTASGTFNAPTPASGPAGTDVTLSGTGFQVSYPIIFRFDSINLTVKSGDSYTNTSGSFSSVITVPQTTAGSHTIYVTVAGTTESRPFSVTASPVLNAPVPTSGPAGSDITLTGTGFPANSSITFTLDPGQIILPFKSGPVTDAAGNINSVVTVPASTASGAYAITVRVGTTTQSKEFTVATATTTTTTTPTTTTTTPTTPTTTTTQPPPTAVINLNASGDNVGANVVVSGVGFSPNASVIVAFDDAQVTTATSSADGIMVATFAVPPAESGPHTISASDGVHTGTVAFTIESEPPETPQPLKPEMEVKVKSPVVFEWEAVEDASPASNPVTYELTIATSASFGASSVVIDKKGLTAISYTLTPAEELELEGRTAPYYWRLRAVDAAANPSPWTGTGEFYMSGSGSFPSWALYTIMGVGAVFVFLIGYWLGRRSAFYY